MTDLMITFIASFLIWFMFVGIVISWQMHGKMKKEHVVYAFLASLLAFVISQSIKIIFPTIRPFESQGLIPLTLTIPTDSSFPSGHASAAFALAISVKRHDKKMGFYYLIIALVVSMGRVLSNVHYYRDIIGGAFIGGLSVFILDRFRERKHLRLDS